MSHSQFHCHARVYLDMHGLIFETSICYWQDQPGSRRSCAGRRSRKGADGDGHAAAPRWGLPSPTDRTGEAGRPTGAPRPAPGGESGPGRSDERRAGGRGRRERGAARAERLPVGSDGSPSPPRGGAGEGTAALAAVAPGSGARARFPTISLGRRGASLGRSLSGVPEKKIAPSARRANARGGAAATGGRSPPRTAGRPATHEPPVEKDDCARRAGGRGADGSPRPSGAEASADAPEGGSERPGTGEGSPRRGGVRSA